MASAASIAGLLIGGLHMAISCEGKVQDFICEMANYCEEHRNNCSECAFFDWHYGCCLNRMPCDWDLITIMDACRRANEYDPTEMH